jgi:hypothetical protein
MNLRHGARAGSADPIRPTDDTVPSGMPARTSTYTTILIRSTHMMSMNEALARVRMRDAASEQLRRGAKRPARLVALAAARRRTQA